MPTMSCSTIIEFGASSSPEPPRSGLRFLVS